MSLAGPPASPPKPVQRRAGRACLSCRARKVRCDVVSKSPCSNCAWDRVQCVVPRSRRTRKIIFAPHSLDATAPAPDTIYCNAEDVVDSGHNVPLSTTAAPPEVPAEPAAPQLPHFIEPPSASDPALAAFWAAQGALSLPPVPLQCALLKSYAHFAYPRMPVIDLTQLCSTVRTVYRGTAPYNLLLYNAILFAGSIHVDGDVLASYGYKDKRSLRQELYRRTELLFVTSQEQDRLVLVQTALLLTTHGQSDHDTKDSWYWLNEALTHAFALGLHKEPLKSSGLDSDACLLRRIWWCCYVRDKVLGMGVDRPTRIRDEEMDITMLSLADLETNVFSAPIVLLGHEQIGPYDAETQIESAELLLAKTQMLTIVSQILQYQASIRARGSRVRSQTATKTAETLNAALNQWYLSLPPSCTRQSVRPDGRRDSLAISCHVRRQLLHMAYYTAMYSLHRPQWTPSSTQSVVSPNGTPLQAVHVPEAIILNSAMNITQVAAELHQHNVDGDLPASAMTMLCPAIFMHLVNLKSSDSDVRQSAIYGFRVCMRVMEKLRQLYPTTEATMEYLETVLQAARPGSGSGELQTSQIRDPGAVSSVMDVLQLNQLDQNDIMAVLGLTPGMALVRPRRSSDFIPFARDHVVELSQDDSVESEQGEQQLILHKTNHSHFPFPPELAQLPPDAFADLSTFFGQGSTTSLGVDTGVAWNGLLDTPERHTPDDQEQDIWQASFPVPTGHALDTLMSLF